ncbi:hypothetical protein PCE1_000881 [Barthelona sp. PCE]
MQGFSIRECRYEDLDRIQNCNLWCLPENYTNHFYVYEFLTSKPTIFVAEVGEEIVGYCLGKIDSHEATKTTPHHYSGLITSVSVKPTFRGLGIAKNLMICSMKAFRELQCSYIQLHVRESNVIAQDMYKNLGFVIHQVENKYYHDKETAYEMRIELTE